MSRGRKENLSADMVGTWFFANRDGDNEQMSIYPAGRIVVFYSNGHRDQTRYENGSVRLNEYNITLKMAMVEGDIIQYPPQGGWNKIWFKIGKNPGEKVLRPLTGPGAKWENGLRLVLRADKIKWTIGEIPSLRVDFRNEGTSPVKIKRAEDDLILIIDGKRFFPTYDTTAYPWPLNPGAHFDNLKILLDKQRYSSRRAGERSDPENQFTLNKTLLSHPRIAGDPFVTEEYLTLGPGKYYVQVTNHLALSNVVEIEVGEKTTREGSSGSTVSSQPVGQKPSSKIEH